MYKENTISKHGEVTVADLPHEADIVLSKVQELLRGLEDGKVDLSSPTAMRETLALVASEMVWLTDAVRMLAERLVRTPVLDEDGGLYVRVDRSDET